MLFHLLRDLSTASEADGESAFSFLRPAYYNALAASSSSTAAAAANPEAAEEGVKRKKKHEEALRKFRSVNFATLT